MKRNVKKLRLERKALEQAILRCLRGCWLGGDPKHYLSAEAQVTLIGLERARRAAGGRQS